MIKYLEYAGYDDNGPHIELLHPSVLTKTAEYSPELGEYVKSIKPEEGKAYLLINAMGAGEYYSSNKNGDWFGKEALAKYHKTFEKLGYVYKHHQNKDPQRSYGKVLFSHYNPDMHRVELIVALDKSKAPDIIEELAKGNYPATSMGCKLPYDICSICGNKARTTADYCNHLKYEMNKVYPDGRKVFAKNENDLKFFDISIVRIPADRTSGVMAKVASMQSAQLSATIAEDVLKRAGVKEADIVKQIDGTVEQIASDPRNLIRSGQMEMPVSEMKELLRNYSLTDLLSTLSGLRIMPTKQDFQRMVIIAVRHPDMDKLCAIQEPLFSIDENTVPLEMEDVSLDNFNDGLAEKIAHWIPEMSLTKPLVIKRAMQKLAATPTLTEAKDSSIRAINNPFGTIATLGGLYLAYNKAMDAAEVPRVLAQSGSFEKWILTRPWFIPILLGAGVAGGTVALQKKLFQKTAANYYNPDYLKRMLVAVPATYIYAGSQENKIQKGQQISEFGNIVRKHPFLTSALATVALGQGARMKKILMTKSAEYSYSDVIKKLSADQIDVIYNDVILGVPQ